MPADDSPALPQRGSEPLHPVPRRCTRLHPLQLGAPVCGDQYGALCWLDDQPHQDKDEDHAEALPANPPGSTAN